MILSLLLRVKVRPRRPEDPETSLYSHPPLFSHYDAADSRPQMNRLRKRSCLLSFVLLYTWYCSFCPHLYAVLCPLVNYVVCPPV